MSVCLALYQQGVSPKNLILAGDSAGGGLVLATLLSLRDTGKILPAAGILLSPWVDLACTGESLLSNAKADPLLVKPPYSLYLDKQDLCHPLASPLYADLTGLPPLQIFVGSTEILLDDAQRLAARAKEHDIEAKLEIWHEMPHVWPLFADFLPEAKQALNSISEFIKYCLNKC
jgi:acetyl esterase/lipase